MKSKKKHAALVTMGLKAQKASNHAIPKSVGRHKNPAVRPVGKKAMTGANYQ